MKQKLCLLVASLLTVPLGHAQTVTISAPDQTSIGVWGTNTENAFGESFTVPAGTGKLESFTFDNLQDVSSTPLAYQTYIYAFRPGTETTSGSALYTSAVQTIPASSSVTDVITPNLKLTPGAIYLAYVNAGSVTQAGPAINAYMDDTGSRIYTGGNFYYTYTGNTNDTSVFVWAPLNANAAFTALFGVSSTSFASTPGLDANERGTASSIDYASASGGTAITHVTTALASLPVTNIAGALDQLSPVKFAHFASTTAINNETFATQDMDIYLQSLRDDSGGGFAYGSGKLDSSGLVVSDPNVDPGLQMIHSRMLAWEDPVSTMTDAPGCVLGGVDMKEMKPSCPACTGASSPWDVFLRGNVVLAQGFSQEDVPHFDDNTESVVVGADYHVSRHFLAGVTASYAHTDATLDTANSSATVDSYSPGVYASWADGGGYVNFLGRYSFHSYTESRNISFLGQTASGATDGHEGVVDLDGGYDFHSGPWTYGPVAGVQYTHLTVNSYSEGNSDAALSVKEDQSDSLRSRLGGEVRYTFKDGGMIFTPHLEATWQHELLTQDRGLTSSFTDFGGGSFTVRTPNASADAALVDLGLDAKVDKSITVFGDYLVQAGQSDYFGQSVQAGVRVNF